MFWWQDEEERTFEAASGIAVSVIETNGSAVYRIAPRQDTRQLCQSDAILCQRETTEV